MLLRLCLLSALCIAFLTSVHAVPVPILEPKCPHYESWARQRDGKELSGGRHQLPFQRPSEDCRTFYSQEVEDAIERLRLKIADPDLFRLFENAFPNTLDTAVRWKGFAWKDGQEDVFTDEDLAFVITGDMYAVPSFSFRCEADANQKCHVVTRLGEPDTLLPARPPGIRRTQFFGRALSGSHQYTVSLHQIHSLLPCLPTTTGIGHFYTIQRRLLKEHRAHVWEARV